MKEYTLYTGNLWTHLISKDKKKIWFTEYTHHITYEPTFFWIIPSGSYTVNS